MATKNTLPVEPELQAGPALTSVPAPFAAPVANPAAGGSYVVDPATGIRTLVTPSTSESATRKVQDPITGAIKRVAVQE